MEKVFKVMAVFDWTLALRVFLNWVEGMKPITIIDTADKTCWQTMGIIKSAGVRIGSPAVLEDQLHIMVSDVPKALSVLAEQGMTAYG